MILNKNLCILKLKKIDYYLNFFLNFLKFIIIN